MWALAKLRLMGCFNNKKINYAGNVGALSSLFNAGLNLRDFGYLQFYLILYQIGQSNCKYDMRNLFDGGVKKPVLSLWPEVALQRTYGEWVSNDTVEAHSKKQIFQTWIFVELSWSNCRTGTVPPPEGSIVRWKSPGTISHLGLVH